MHNLTQNMFNKAESKPNLANTVFTALLVGTFSSQGLTRSK